MPRADRSPEITAHMGSFIKARRVALGMSLQDVADAAGCTKAHVWEIEKGRAKNPTLWMILGLCDGLRCTMNDLLGLDVSSPRFSSAEIELVAAHRKIFGNR